MFEFDDVTCWHAALPHCHDRDINGLLVTELSVWHGQTPHTHSNKCGVALVQPCSHHHLRSFPRAVCFLDQLVCLHFSCYLGDHSHFSYYVVRIMESCNFLVGQCQSQCGIRIPKCYCHNPSGANISQYCLMISLIARRNCSWQSSHSWNNFCSISPCL